MGPANQKDSRAEDQRTLGDLFWAAIGAATAIALALWLVGERGTPFLLASLGGSTVFLFALTGTDAAQPRALFGGHFIGALIGILCFEVFGDGLRVSTVAVVLTLVLMVITRTIHPPAGANPLFMVQYHAGFSALYIPVGLGVATLFIVAFFWSRVRPGKHYPARWW